MHNFLLQVLPILDGFYGSRHWRPGRNALDELVLTILSQNTTDRNSGRAFHELKRTYPTWHQVCNAPVGELAHVIRIAGLAHSKAPRIQSVLQHLATDYAEYSLDFLAQLPPSDAQTWLTNHPGIGPKTAACVLLFGAGLVCFRSRGPSESLGRTMSRATSDSPPSRGRGRFWGRGRFLGVQSVVFARGGRGSLREARALAKHDDDNTTAALLPRALVYRSATPVEARSTTNTYCSCYYCY